MDYWLGAWIDDYTLYKIIEGLMIILCMVTIYLGIRIALIWKYLKCKNALPGEIISQKASFTRVTIFIFIAGFFMLIHEFFEGLEKNASDYVTFELFELIALSGLVLFFFEWHRILNDLRKK